MEQSQLAGDGKTYEQEGRDSATMLAGLILAAAVLLAVLGAKGLHVLPLSWPWAVAAGYAGASLTLFVPAFLARKQPRA